MLEDVIQSSEWLKARINSHPSIAIILGTGLGSLAKEIEVKVQFDYWDIPHFPISTVEGHAGRLLVGTLGGKDIIAMQGRFHYYEGYSMQQVTYPIRVFRELGIKTLFVSNAAGGTNPDFHIGDIMMITDHINMLPENPLRGKNVDYGPRFLDMSHAYSPALMAKARQIAHDEGIALREGVYLATQGPTYETPAEYHMFRLLGADAVGMSTVPEIIVARHCGIECFGISVITNVGQQSAQVSHQKVEAAAQAAQTRLTQLFKQLIQQL